MSFLTERFYQVLDNHKLYSYITSEENLRFFMERHVICVWGYQTLMRSLQKDLMESAQPLNSDPFKEALRLINELILDEELEAAPDGKITSHLELYLDAMEDLNCDMVPILGFFDLLESGVGQQKALRGAGFSKEAVAFGSYLINCLRKPLHQRATVLFYEGEPYIPDAFLGQLDQFNPYKKVEKLIDYFERHIEGLKKPGFSGAGRLVEILCLGDNKLNRQAEKTAESVMSKRIDLWNATLEQLKKSKATMQVLKEPTLLRLVT